MIPEPQWKIEGKSKPLTITLDWSALTREDSWLRDWFSRANECDAGKAAKPSALEMCEKQEQAKAPLFTKDEVEDLLDSSSLMRRAYLVARRAHAGQTYSTGKGATSSVPYIVHLGAVTKLVEGDNDAVAVAWLHDVLEDTSVTFHDLMAWGFPALIRTAVWRLTHREWPGTYLDYIQKIKASHNDLAIKVKIADLKVNLSSPGCTESLKQYVKALNIFGVDIKKVEQGWAFGQACPSNRPQDKGQGEYIQRLKDENRGLGDRVKELEDFLRPMAEKELCDDFHKKLPCSLTNAVAHCTVHSNHREFIRSARVLLYGMLG